MKKHLKTLFCFLLGIALYHFFPNIPVSLMLTALLVLVLIEASKRVRKG